MNGQEWLNFLVSIGGEPLDGSGFETEQAVQDEQASSKITIVESEEGEL